MESEIKESCHSNSPILSCSPSGSVSPLTNQQKIRASILISLNVVHDASIEGRVIMEGRSCSDALCQPFNALCLRALLKFSLNLEIMEDERPRPNYVHGLFFHDCSRDNAKA